MSLLPDSSPVDNLAQQAVGHFRSWAGKFGLSPETLTAQRVLNWGGFVSHSFKVGDGERFLHLKLSVDQANMRRWLAVHDRLEREYRAPRILAWVDLPGTSYGGLVFEHIEGGTWETATHPGLFHELRNLLGRLHGDVRLADRIGDGARSYRECWERRYRDQFEQDLETVRGSRPSSVTDARLSWMEEETRKVLALAADSAAFEGMSRSPCHWDLWPNNVMVEGGGRWWVLDWDGLAVGDEAEDFATLAWPFVSSEGKDWRDLLGGEGEGPFAARMDLHLRAITLDYLIDVLADWAECDVPEWQEQVRRQKEAEHQRYLDWYRSRWG